MAAVEIGLILKDVAAEQLEAAVGRSEIGQQIGDLVFSGSANEIFNVLMGSRLPNRVLDDIINKLDGVSERNKKAMKRMIKEARKNRDRDINKGLKDLFKALGQKGAAAAAGAGRGASMGLVTELKAAQAARDAAAAAMKARPAPNLRLYR